MSGHSKFANIKHKKERNDSARAKVFTRLGRELAVAVKSGGADPASNMRLKEIIVKARANNMSGDTIDRSIKKAAGDLNAVNFESVTYEGYGPNGAAVIVRVLTDNRNRAAANVRNAFTKGGGNMGTTGCVSFQFREKGLIMIEKDALVDAKPALDEDGLMMLALDAGAEDFITSIEGCEIITAPENFSSVLDSIEKSGVASVSAEITMLPDVFVNLSDESDVKKMRKLLDLLDEEDDVQDVFHNWENEE